MAGSERVFPVRRLAPDGLEAWRQVLERGYEGGATRRWLKVKQRDWIVAEDGFRRRISATASSR